VALENGAVPPRRSGAAQHRWVVHLALLATVTASLVLEPVVTVHVVLGLAFVGLVVVHLIQRREVSMALARRLARLAGWGGGSGRLALADALLVALTAAMLASGLYDWIAGHPTRIRWHALSGMVLAGFLLVHTLRRRRRLYRSSVR
jgi:hypothetical protein